MARLLVIDDEKDLIELVRYNLEKEGYDAIAASDGQTGLALTMHVDVPAGMTLQKRVTF